MGLIFDPEFWYDQRCWYRWLNALLEEGTADKINVPLGNQDSSWRADLNIPIYLTLRGLEKASDFLGSTRWLVRKATRPESFCVAVLPVSVLREMPADLSLGELSEYWARTGQEVRIFCEGWLHSFNAIKHAGCRQDLISMCSWHGLVLELGCGTGLMAKTCKEMGFDVRWVGIDLKHPSLLQARPWLDLAVKADINRTLPVRGEVRFDRIVCGDVLEHLPYPWHLLSSLGHCLQPHGLLVASFPNVGHWSIVEDLIAGRWDDTPSGILCVSHLRFGTRLSWERWLEQSGWLVLRWEAEKVPLPDNWAIPTGKDTSYDRESLETVRYRVLARPASEGSGGGVE